MPQTLFRSTDASAPVLDGNAGSLVAVLDGCLVTGYGAKAALGWAKAFTGTNKAVYRAPEGTRFFLRVQDDAPSAFLGRLARVRAYESMTDVDTGVDPFPTIAQKAATAYHWGKSLATGATARPWALIGDGKRFILLTFGNHTATQWGCNFFGDIIPFKTGDAYHCLITAYDSEAASYANAGPALAAAINGTNVNHYMCRRDDNLTKSILVGKIASPGFASGATMGAHGANIISYPDPISGKLLVHPVTIVHAATTGCVIRGEVPGLCDILHNNPLVDQDTFSIGAATYQLFLHESNGKLALKTSAWE